MIAANNFRHGLVIQVDGQLYSVVEFSRVKPGKGGAYVKTKIKRMSDGNVIDRTFRSEERVEDVRLDHRSMQFLYKDGELLCLMDNETYEQQSLTAQQLGDTVKFLTEGASVKVSFHEGNMLVILSP